MKIIFTLLVCLQLFECEINVREKYSSGIYANQVVQITEVERLKYEIFWNKRGALAFLSDDNEGVIFWDKENLYKPYFIEHGDRILEIDGEPLMRSLISYKALKLGYLVKYEYLLIADIKDIQVKIKTIHIKRNSRDLFIETKNLIPEDYMYIEKRVFSELKSFFKDGKLDKKKVWEYENSLIEK